MPWRRKNLNIHLSTKKLDLKSNSGFADPHKTENAREHHRRLVSVGDRQEQAQNQAKDKRSPAELLVHNPMSNHDKNEDRDKPKIPVAQPFTHTTLQDHVGIRPASNEPAQVAAESSSLASLSIPNSTAAALHQAAQ